MSEYNPCTMRSPPTQAAVMSALRYEPETGKFFWRHRANRNSTRAAAGQEAGCLHSQGYIVIGLGGVQHQAHRLAWLYVHGDWPPLGMDHISGDRADNRMPNLRLATVAQNMWNRRAHATNALGLKGVRLRRGKYEASIMVRGQYRYLGTFVTPEAASAAYLKAAQEGFGEFARAA